MAADEVEIGEVMPFSHSVELVDFICGGELGAILHPTNICSCLVCLVALHDFLLPKVCTSFRRAHELRNIPFVNGIPVDACHLALSLRPILW